FAALAEEIVHGRSSLPSHVSSPIVSAARALAGRERFFHWTLEFADVFHDETGAPRSAPGFDAVVGNPPWEVLRGARGCAAVRSAAAERGTRLTAFARASGLYPHKGDGHANLYQLFVERALSLTRRGGRIGLVLPSGFASDHGSAALRRHTL